MSTVSSLSYKAGYRVHPFTTMPTTQFAWLEGATVSIEFGYVPEKDKLFFDYDGAFPITGSFNQDNGVLYLSGKATSSEYASAITSVVFFTTSEDGQPRRVTWSFGVNTFHFSLTEHSYQYVQGRKSWNGAKRDCEEKVFFNNSGYLATVTTADEQLELGAKATFTAWLGGNDLTTFADWRWVTGPEATEQPNGRLFWKGLSMYTGGVAPENQYAAWNRFQPLNAQGEGNDYLYLVNSADQETAYWAVAKDTDVIDGYICEFGAPNGNAAELAASSGSRTLYLDCGLFTDRFECKNRAGFGCSWTSKGKCEQITCSQYRIQHDCASDWRCDWNVDGEMGVCTNSQCAAFGSEACAANPACTIRGAAKTCQPARCSDQGSACGCRATEGCTWRSGLCSYDDTINCDGMDTIYLLDGSLKMSEQFGRFSQGFLGLTDVLAKTQFSLTGQPAGTTGVTSETFGQRVGFIQYGNTVKTTPSNTGTGGRLTGDQDEVEADLQWHQTNFAPSSTERYVNSALRRAETMFDAANSNRNRAIVIVSSGEILDAAALAASFRADRQNGGILADLAKIGVKIVGVSLKSASAQTAESYAADMSLKDLTASSGVLSSTLAMLRPKVIFAMCDASSLATFANPSMKNELCTGFTTNQQCQTDPRCGWDAAAQTCRNSLCLSRCDEGTCKANPSCAWANSTCVQKCGTLNETTCNGLGKGNCIFNDFTSMCENLPCISNPTEDGCIADPSGCEWNPMNPVPCTHNPCMTTDPTTCVKNDLCAWNGQQCYVDLCKQQTTATDCGKQVQCSYDVVAKKCKQNLCGDYLDEKNCQKDFRCGWSITNVPPACGPAECTYYNADPSTAKMNCQARSSDCYWQPKSENNLKDMCIKKTCELMKASCDCAALDGCIWRNGQCKDDPFVQCPATDVIFLVEATPVMLDAFGRHPNGYIGIIEAIRSWSKEAPFSTTGLSATGFRLALVNYGQKKRALFVPADVGAGGNLTSDPQQWLGAGQSLDWNQKNMKKYATDGGTGEVALRPALQRAVQIFKQSPSPVPARKRLVVILGHSAITDGGSAMSKEIAELETMGAKIFSNVLRRFSYILAPDRVSAEYMRPIASDPPSVFFSFTTIDAMREALLEGFCDPSTGTGKTLEISRDRELPCTWLDGKDECNIQGSCSWNGNATLKCPRSDQCPNLGCIALPTAIANKFQCRHCELKSGELDCSLGNNFASPPGVCQKSSCSQVCQASCDTTTGCAFNADTGRCDLDFCKPLGTLASCNANLGCVWSMNPTTGSDPKCVPSVCGRMRSTASCDAVSQTEELTPGRKTTYNPCKILKHLSPQICSQKRCPMYDSATCQATTQKDVCTWQAAASGRRCEDIECTYPDAELCEFDSQCYFDPFKNKCFKRSPSGDCVLSGYSDWSACTAPCGPAITFKSRSVIQFPTRALGASCALVASLGCQGGVANCGNGDNTMSVNKSCTMTPPDYTNGWVPANPNIPRGQWPSSCTLYCGALTSRDSCMFSSACRWIGDTCLVKPFLGCGALDQTQCIASDQCRYSHMLSMCEAYLPVCQASTKASCQRMQNCAWRTGANSILQGKTAGVDVQLFNPGQDAIYPFDTLEIADRTAISGATVTIEINYQRGKDVLRSTYSQQVKSQWVEQSGTLLLFGNASAAEYAKAIRYITFKSTSTRVAARTITWSLGANTLYASATGHHYRRIAQAGAPYAFADIECEKLNMHGMKGYLATVTSPDENTVVAAKLGGAGWISGDDSAGQWEYSSGPNKGTRFWKGGSDAQGGQPVSGAYSNWAPPNQTNLNGEPLINLGDGDTTGHDRLYLARSGYWESRSSDTVNVEGFFCEFGGMPTDVKPPFQLGGSMIVGVGGCVTASCVWHSTQDQCNFDVECAWNNGVCEAGCGSRSTENECAASSRCRWTTEILPPACEVDVCAGLGKAACNVKGQCDWSDANSECKYKLGCGQFETDTTCSAVKTCMWTGQFCMAKGCGAFGSIAECRISPQCSWNFEKSMCDDRLCQQPNQKACQADKNSCMWNTAGELSQGFTPNGGVIYPFATRVEPPSNSNDLIDGMTVGITMGFQRGSDFLGVGPSASVDAQFTSSYNPDTGVITFTVNTGVQVTAAKAFAFLQQNVRFSSSSNALIRRQVSYVLSLNTVYSQQQQTYFKNHGNTIVTTFADARKACAKTTLYGMTGSLAVLDNEVSNLLVKSLRPYGWFSAIGDANAVWSWQTTTKMVPFWAGMSSLGKPMTINGSKAYAQWSLGEPSIAPGYGYFGTNGYWKAVADGAPQAGVICQYGSATEQPSMTITGVKNLDPAGCFVAPCINLKQSKCGRETTCKWEGGKCIRDLSCVQGGSPNACSLLQGCYWDYTESACRSAPATPCSAVSNPTNCTQIEGCGWNPKLLPTSRDSARGLGACEYTGCRRHPARSPCTADSTCRWMGRDGPCQKRLCGYPDATNCWRDSLCMWENTAASQGCVVNPCAGLVGAACTAKAQCELDADSVCKFARCVATDKATCLQDRSCLFLNGKCTNPNCNPSDNQRTCNKNDKCYFFVSSKSCQAAQCISNTNLQSCEQGQTVLSKKPCIWVASKSKCRQPTYAEQHAPPTTDSCEKQTNPNMWWLWVFLSIILILLGVIFHRLYLAHVAGKNFLDPTRKNYQFNPHQQYAAAIVDDAAKTGIETNVQL